MNPMDFIKDFQTLQSKLGLAQERLKSFRAEGSSGGDLVKVVVDGTMEAISVTIDPIAVDPRDIKMLEELIAASFTDAVRKMRLILQKDLGKAAVDLNIPSDLTGKGP